MDSKGVSMIRERERGEYFGCGLVWGLGGWGVEEGQVYKSGAHAEFKRERVCKGRGEEERRSKSWLKLFR